MCDLSFSNLLRLFCWVLWNLKKNHIMSQTYVLLYNIHIRCYISSMTSHIPHILLLGRFFPSFRSMCLGSRDSSPSCTIISIRLISMVKLIKLTLILYGQMCCENHYKNTSLDSLLFQTVYTETWLLRILLFFFSTDSDPVGHGHMTCRDGSFGSCGLLSTSMDRWQIGVWGIWWLIRCRRLFIVFFRLVW